MHVITNEKLTLFLLNCYSNIAILLCFATPALIFPSVVSGYFPYHNVCGATKYMTIPLWLSFLYYLIVNVCVVCFLIVYTHTYMQVYMNTSTKDISYSEQPNVKSTISAMGIPLLPSLNFLQHSLLPSWSNLRERERVVGGLKTSQYTCTCKAKVQCMANPLQPVDR